MSLHICANFSNADLFASKYSLAPSTPRFLLSLSYMSPWLYVILAVVFCVVPPHSLFFSTRIYGIPHSSKKYAVSMPTIPPPIIKTSVSASPSSVGKSSNRVPSLHTELILSPSYCSYAPYMRFYMLKFFSFSALFILIIIKILRR